MVPPERASEKKNQGTIPATLSLIHIYYTMKKRKITSVFLALGLFASLLFQVPISAEEADQSAAVEASGTIDVYKRQIKPYSPVLDIVKITLNPLADGSVTSVSVYLCPSGQPGSYLEMCIRDSL